MMTTFQAQARFEQLLREADFDVRSPNCRMAWNVWKLFGQEPVDAPDDGFLFECGNYASNKTFSFNFVRQFVIEVDGEYNHMIHISCNFSGFCTTEELEHLEKIALWSYDCASLESYFAEVEDLKTFQLLMAHTEAISHCAIREEKV